jgi:ribosomal protein S18 acetylase RimI-like enzyme
MLYRLYEDRDFPPLYAIEEACFEPPQRFSRGYMRHLVSSAAAVTWVAEDAGQLAGFAIVEWSGAPAENVGYIQTIEVSPQHRRRGIALELLRRIETSARGAGATQIWLHVDKQNVAAIHLYCAEGYAEKGTHAHYYGRARDAAIYCKQLSGDDVDPHL